MEKLQTKVTCPGQMAYYLQKLLCATQVVSDALSCKHSENVAESSLLIS